MYCSSTYSTLPTTQNENGNLFYSVFSSVETKMPKCYGDCYRWHSKFLSAGGSLSLAVGTILHMMVLSSLTWLLWLVVMLVP